MKNQILFYFLILLFSTFYISFSHSQTIQEYNCLANIFTKFNLLYSYPKNATGGYSNICLSPGITCSGGTVKEISISAFNEEPPSNAVLTPAELLCLPNLTYLKLDRIKVNTDVLFTKFGLVDSLTLQNIPKGGIDINKIDRPFPSYSFYFIGCEEFNNTILYSSYLNNIKTFYLQVSYVTFIIDQGTNFTNLNTLSLWSLNVPDLSSYQSLSLIKLDLRKDYDTSTLANYANINCYSIQISFPESGPSIPSFIETNHMVNYVTITSPKFLKPSGFIDMSTGYNLNRFFLSSVGPDFNVNGEFPIMFSSTVDTVSVYSGSWKTVPAFANVSTGTLIFTYSGLTDFPSFYNGSSNILDFSNNALTGTIDKSYCNSELIVSNNKLTGTIPSCYTCYFGYPISTSGVWSKTPFYNRFSGNQFTNYVSNPGCTTFAPQVRANDNLSGFIISGTDIGWEATPYKFNGSYSCQSKREKKEFNCYVTNNFLKGVRYASILNTWHNKNYTFSFISSPPDATTVSISTNTLTIDGTYFSSYLGQSIQTVKVTNVDCTISSTDFFKIVCTTVSSIPSSASASQLLTIATSNETKKFYIQTSDGYKNTKACPNDCSTNSRGICDLSTGTCVCNQGFKGSDCSEIPCPTFNSLECNGSPNICNTTTGVCKCSGRNFGSDCSSIQCVIPNCSNFGTCDTTIGVCKCDSSHQGNDCSLPLIQCPTFNSLPCNGGSNECNNQTGTCSCDSSHQGNDCSLPLTQCPTFNSLPCNGGSNQCNNQTGTCSCDSSHQGNDCSLPLTQCPTFNSLPCNGGPNQCNNQTGTCSCDSYHQGIDCSLPLIQCPTFNSLSCNGGSNQCNNQTGTCSCDSSHQGSDCSLPLIECLNNCNGNGICDTYKGKCQCTPGKFIGEDCSIIYHYVTSVKPSTTKGGLASFYGVFGKVHDSLTIKIGELDCKIEIDQVSENQIDCIAPAGTGIKSINVTQNGVTYFKKNLYKYQSIDTVLQCPKDCSGANNGICNTTTGQCTCINGYGSHDCSVLSNNNNDNDSGSDSDSELPPSEVIVDQGKTNITNGETNFLIYIKSISEIDYEGNVLKTFKLNNIWEKVNSTDSNTYIYKQKLENTNCIVESKIEEITDKNGKLFSFADVDFKVESGSVKFSISVSNYTYISNLNNLQIELISETSQLVQDDNNCNKVDTSLDTSNFNSESNLNYIKISKNNKVLSGRFINKVISDGKVTFLDSIATKSTSDSISITLNLPHCTSQCLVDPDFSVLLSSDFKTECGEKDDKKSYVIPVAVVASVAGVASIGAAGFIIYKKKFIENPLKKKLRRA
ncbi:hypothetical protein ACTFIZ_011261 [Dictyostelium cf. discoideum]